MLDTWEKAVVEDVIARIESQPADPTAKLRQLFELASELASSPDGLAVELALRDWSRRDSDVAERLRRVDNRRMEYMRSLFGQFCVDENDVEARCMLVFSLFIGSYFIAAQHGDKIPLPGAATRARSTAQRVVGLTWATTPKSGPQRETRIRPSRSAWRTSTKRWNYSARTPARYAQRSNRAGASPPWTARPASRSHWRL